MKDLKKYKLVTTANNVEVVSSHNRLSDAQDIEDDFWNFCSLFFVDGESVLYRLDESHTYKMCWKHIKTFKHSKTKRTLDLS